MKTEIETTYIIDESEVKEKFGIKGKITSATKWHDDTVRITVKKE